MGREAELIEIDHLLATGGATLVLVGPLGVGKSTLLAEAARRAEQRGYLVLAGTASPLVEGRAYALILDALRTYVRELERSQRAALVVGLPELGRLFPGLDLPEPEPLHDPALEKTRLFEALVRLLERLSRQQPLLLSLDDLHWADAQSLELLGHLAGSLSGQRVAILAAYRSDEAPLSRSLRTLLQVLDRAGLARRLEVGRLPAQDVALRAHALLGGTPPPALLTLLESRAGGVPLFIEGLTEALLQAGALTQVAGVWTLQPGAAVPLPAGLRDLLLERLERLTEPERALVEILAVCGDAVRYEVLAAASQLPEVELLEGLEGLTRQRLVAESATGARVSFGLAHPLFQETAYQALPILTRRRLHLRVIEAMKAQGASEVSRLAVHYMGAGPLADGEAALAVLVAAADEARAVYGHDAAARYLTAALELVRQGRRRALLPTLLAQLGDALVGQGESGAALVLWQEAIAVLEQGASPDSIELARLYRRIGQAEFHRGRLTEGLAAIGRAKALLGMAGMTEELAGLYFDEVWQRTRIGDVAGAAGVADEMAAAVGDSPPPAVTAALLGVEQRVAVYQNRLREAVAIGQRALAGSLQPLAEHRIRESIAWCALQLADLATLGEACAANQALARRVGAPALEASTYQYLVAHALMAGQWEKALQDAAAFLALAQRAEPRRIPVAHLSRSMILARRGEYDAAREALAAGQAALAAAGKPLIDLVRLANDTQAVLARELGQTAELRAALAEAAPIPVPEITLCYMIRGEAWGLLGEPAKARAALAPMSDESPIKAAVLLTVAGSQGDPEGYRKAAEIYEGCGLRFWGARARLGWATLVAATEPAEAAATAREVLPVFEGLGAKAYSERTRRLLRELGVALPVRPAAEGDGLLSPREWEVAQLVAAGLANAEIAERLYISQRTVTTHLQRIYSRLSISRTELAALVTGRGSNT